MLQASTSSVPQGPQRFTVQLFVPLSLLHLLLASVMTARTGKQGFSYHQGSSSSNRSWTSMMPPTFPQCQLGRASEHSADLHSTLQWHSALQICLLMPCDGTVHCWNRTLWQSHTVTAVFWQKEIIFCMTLQSACGRPTLCMLMLLCLCHLP